MRRLIQYCIFIVMLFCFTGIAFGQGTGIDFSGTTRGYSICADNAGNTFSGGIDNGKGFILKQTAGGVKIWCKSLSFSQFTISEAIVTSLDIIGDTVFGCGTFDFDNGGFYFKLDAITGNIYWVRSSFESRSYLSCMRYSNGKYFLTGGVRAQNKDGGKIFAVSSANGNIIWETPCIRLSVIEDNNNSTSTRLLHASTIQNGQLFITGASLLNGFSIARPLLIGIDENGSIFLEKYFQINDPDPGVKRAIGQQIGIDGNDSIVICYNNYTNGNFYSGFIKTDLAGNVGYSKKFYQDPTEITQTVMQSMNISATGYTFFGAMYYGLPIPQQPVLLHSGTILFKTDLQGNLQQNIRFPYQSISIDHPITYDFVSGGGAWRNGLHYFVESEYDNATGISAMRKFVTDDNLNLQNICSVTDPWTINPQSLPAVFIDPVDITAPHFSNYTSAVIIGNLDPIGCTNYASVVNEVVACDSTIVHAVPSGFMEPAFLWSNGSTSASQTVTTNDTLIVRITDANCCYIIDTIVPTISQNTLSMSLPEDPIVCVGAMAVMFTIVPQVVANPNNVTYNWNTGETTPQIAVNTSGTYWVDATNTCGTVRDSIIVTINSLPEITGNPLIEACDSDFPIQYSPDLVSNSSTMSWENGVTTLQRLIDSAGSYTLTATNVCGQSSFTVTVTEKPIPQIQWISAVDTCLSSGASLPLTPVFTDSDQIVWSTGETADTIFADQSGTYTVTASNECGSVNESALITINYLPDLNLPTSLDTCFEIGEGFYYTAQGTPGNYSWSSGSQTATELITDIGVYDVTLSNVCGSVTKSMIVNRAANLSLSVVVDSVLSCQGNFPVSQLKIETNYEYEILNEDLQPQSGNISKTGWYYIHAFNKCGEIFDSVFINLQENQYFYLPNAFTPNQDAYNEYYSWKGENIVIREFFIFNRWGEEVFDGSDPLGWDGTFDGKNCPDGIYSVRIIIENCLGIGEELTGFVTLLR